MPASPFGLAYGLGAGMAIAPQQMFNREQQANQLAMQGLQQQLMQHQVAQQQAEDQAFSQPVTPQMDQPTTQQAMQGLLGTPAPMQGGIPSAPGTVATGDTLLQQAVAPTKHVYITPYEKPAYEYNQRADKLEQMGFARSAMALRQQAAQMYGQHMDMARGIAVQSILSGDKSRAVGALNSIGMPATDVGKVGTPDGDMYYIQNPDGNTTMMSKEDLSAVAADPSKVSDIIARQEQYKNLYGWRVAAAQAGAESREKVAAINAEARKYTSDNALAGSQTRAAATINAASIRSSAPDPKSKFLGYIASRIKNDKPGMSDTDALTAAAQSPAYTMVKDDETKAAQQLRLIATSEMKKLSDPLTGKPPKPGTPEADAYGNWQNTINGLGEGLKARVTRLGKRPTTPPPTTPNPAGNGNPPTPDSVWSPVKKGWFRPDGKGGYIPSE